MIEKTHMLPATPWMARTSCSSRPVSRRAKAHIDLAPPVDRAENANIWVMLSLAGTSAFMMPGVDAKFGQRIAPLQFNRGGIATRRSADDEFDLT